MKNKLEFNVICWGCNSHEFEPYDIMPYLIRVYKDKKKKKKIDLKTFEDYKKFILDESMYQWWSRCEYEIILSDWPCNIKSEKWDVYRQIQMNIDLITKLFMEHFPNKKKEIKKH